MKPLLLLLGLGLAAVVSQAQPTTISAALPPDTVAGHAQLLRAMSEGLCEKLDAASQRLDFKALPSAQSDKLMRKLTNELVLENRAQFEQLRKRVARPRRRLYFSLLGREAILRMADTCPSAGTFLTDLNYEGRSDKSPLSDAERAMLLPITEDVCQRLSVENARVPLARRSEAETKLVVGAAIRESLQAHAADLNKYYGHDIMDNPLYLGNAGERMAMLMFGRCSSYLLMLSLRPARE
ncbi:MAG: hypothetical protein EOO36_14295 [Cytophagaceae bacterium]|nr:MAG: hypothetical protein EOO36_14295 [Cytophagaceae bacterium]